MEMVVPLKVLVSMMSAPASRYSMDLLSITSGRVDSRCALELAAVLMALTPEILLLQLRR
jgi:hypothetical protein